MTATLNIAQALEDIRANIMRMTDEQIAILSNIARNEREFRVDQKRDTLIVGKTYNFTTREGRTVSATLVKIAPKNCKLVQNVIVVPGMPTRTVNWTVHPSFIKA